MYNNNLKAIRDAAELERENRKMDNAENELETINETVELLQRARKNIIKLSDCIEEHGDCEELLNAENTIKQMLDELSDIHYDIKESY